MVTDFDSRTKLNADQSKHFLPESSDLNIDKGQKKPKDQWKSSFMHRASLEIDDIIKYLMVSLQLIVKIIQFSVESNFHFHQYTDPRNRTLGQQENATFNWPG